MKQKFIEWFTKNNNGCSPAMEDDRSFVYEMTQHMFEAYQAGVAEGEAKCAALAAESAGMKKFCEDAAFDADYESELLGERGGFVDGLSLVKTPATDAFLAEVRAQGVDALVERRLTAARLAKEAGHEITARDLEGEAIRARFFAMEIRKGVQS
ncbi:Uncharacterised protein [Enterobacter hormaechei]|uniref:hypothetical protein n=1 Tax=Enterobacter hormaechei TaxID=158836 RepID=UPI00079438E4|nr:hypothetical protein [Enterobacter hormaechei]SAG63882.1 Uncharacterised protein [Enterobacter hormaechei]